MTVTIPDVLVDMALGRADRRRGPQADRLPGRGESLAPACLPKQGFEAELVHLFARGRRSAAPAMAALAAVAAAAATLWAPAHAALGWLAAVFAALGLNCWLAGRFPGGAQAAAAAAGWRRLFIAGEGLLGTVWASLTCLPGISPEPAAQSFALVLLSLAAAMTATALAPIPAAVTSSILPMALATLAFLRPADIWAGNLPLMTLVCGSQLYFVMLARRLREASLETLSYQAEKDELIAELEQAKAKSDLARRRAEAASLAKSRFLATMSHELRTPLNAIVGFSEVMKGELFGAHAVESYKDYSRDIHASGQHLLILINEILDLSRIESGQHELKEEAVALAEIGDGCRRLLRLRAKKKRITVEQAAELGLPRLWADGCAIRQVILNILANAINYTQQDGVVSIKIGWTAKDGQYVAVRDNGPGIPEDEIDLVMSYFGRGSQVQTLAGEGSGLGLPIAKGLIELHGGTFTLKSKLGEGTEVIMVFPPGRIRGSLAGEGGAGLPPPPSVRLMPAQ